MESSKPEEGWVLLLNTQKLHYIRGGKSLCRKWMYFGSSLHTMLQDMEVTIGKDPCSVCLKKLGEGRREKV